MKYRKKSDRLTEAVTFDEFVEYGKQRATNIVNGMPWSFDYNGHPVSHENDECYLVPTLIGILRFTPDFVLVTGAHGEIYPCRKETFEKTYEKVGD